MNATQLLSEGTRPASDQLDDGDAGIHLAWQRVAVDAHVHLQGDVVRTMHSAARNFSAAGPPPDAGAMLLTEIDGCDVFAALQRGIPGVSTDGTGEAISLLVRSVELPVLVVAGRQVVTRERVEVLLLGTLTGPRDGIALDELIAWARVRDVLAALPWGLGKWIGRRGALVREAIANHGELLLGDIPARSRLIPAGPLRSGARVLLGTDPLPLAGEGDRVGSFGQIVSAAIDPQAPAASLLAALRAPGTPIARYGKRQSLRTMASLQLALRRRPERV